MKRMKSSNIAVLIAGVLLCLVLISAHMTAGMFAKYTTLARGADAAGTAKFSVKAEMVPTETTGSYQIRISNGSQVAVSCGIDVEFDAGVTDTQVKAVKLMRGQELLKELQFQQHMSFGDVCILAPGSENTDYALILDLTPDNEGSGTDTPDFDNGVMRGEDYEIPFSVIVDFTQVH